MTNGDYAVDHLLFSGSIPFLMGLLWYIAKGCRASLRFLVVLPIGMILPMVWSVIPDIPRLLGMNALYRKLYMDPRCDIFLWHYTLDWYKNDTLVKWGPKGVGFMALCLIIAAWRELYLAEKQNEE